MFQDIAAVATTVALIVVVFQLVSERTSRHREFENLYVQRYWELMDRLSFDVPCRPAIERLNAQDGRACLAYLRLCEDELDLRKQGFVTDSTWTIWAEGIKSQSSAAPFADILKGQPDKQLPALRAFLKDNGKDPLKRSRLSRWLSGLH
jgi:hypothetical protein